MTPALRVVMAQLNLRVGDIDGNVQRIIEVAAQARQQQADLLVLPELSLCGYPPEDLLLRASMQRRIEAALQRLCQDVQGISLLLGLPWREGERHPGQNRLFVISKADIAEFNQRIGHPCGP